MAEKNIVTGLVSGMLRADWCISFFSPSVLAELGTMQKLSSALVDLCLGRSHQGLLDRRSPISNYRLSNQSVLMTHRKAILRNCY